MYQYRFCEQKNIFILISFIRCVRRYKKINKEIPNELFIHKFIVTIDMIQFKDINCNCEIY